MLEQKCPTPTKARMRNQWRESYNAQRRRKEIEEEKKEVKEG